MPTITRSKFLATLSLMLLAATAARADDPLTIRIYNDDADDVVVTVYDMNAQPPEPVLANQRINGFAWIPVSVAASDVGNGHVTWIARTAGVDFRRCGYQEMHAIANDSFLYVSADSSCK
jgi:hypothetical protein